MVLLNSNQARRNVVVLSGLIALAVMFSGPSAFALDQPVSEVVSAADLEFFEKHVRPLLVSKCYECHSASDVNGGLRLDSLHGLRRGGESGAVIVAKQPDHSRLIEAVRYQNRDMQMPPDGRLADAQIAVLEKWVAMGAPHPVDSTRSSNGRAPTGMSVEEGRQFWSFRPVADPDVPSVSQADWVANPIDAFVLNRLEEAGLRPASRADRRTLIRRVTLDLIGLPLTINEVEAFVADTSDDAFAQLVDRLLASPQYGVRWGRHWLDVARYADSNGLDENLAFGNAWRYRDYVMQSFNDDKQFNLFVTEQLAGDLLPDSTLEARTATGFLVLGAKVLAEPDMEKLVMDTVDEQLDTVGKAFMGMTIGCSRCHDHKFDPLTQSDYYALAAIFKSTKTFSGGNTGAIKYWNEHSFATEAEKEQLKNIDAEIAAKNKAATAFANTARTNIRTEAESKAAEYLYAATRFNAAATLRDIEAIANEFNLHARILHHCRKHLEFNHNGFFHAWHRLHEAGENGQLRTYYTALISAAMSADKSSAKAATFTSQDIEAARAAVKDASGFLAVPPKADYAFDTETLLEYFRLQEEARLVESRAMDEPSVMTVGEEKILTSLPIHIRGSHTNLGEPVARNFPAVMRSESGTSLPEDQSGRLQLAQWLTSEQHPLTARVFVNRVWTWHFGKGLVGTTENFGRLGDRPSHPQLLDWLAREFMRSGWSVKHLHRLILNSSTWQMASTTSEATAAEAEAVDPENRLLWKFRLQRLSAEQIRDSLLQVSGRLDTSIGGKSVPLRNKQFVFNHTSEDHTKYDSLRRAAFLPVIRNNLYTFFEQFDFPDPTMPTGHRNTTTVAPQTLLMMNSELVMDSADAFARKLIDQSSDNTQRITFAYQAAFGRHPTDIETQQAMAFVALLKAESFTAAGLDANDEHRAWATFCHSLFASNEFIYVK